MNMRLKKSLNLLLNYGTKIEFSTSARSFKNVSRLLKNQSKIKTSLTPKFLENLKKWPKLLDAEVEIQFERLNEHIRNTSDWRTIEERDFCIGNLTITSTYNDVFCGTVVELSSNATLRTRWLKIGLPAFLHRIDSDGHLKKVSEGHIVGFSGRTVKVCVYKEREIKCATTSYVLTQSPNSGTIKYLKSVLKNPSTLSSDSVHLINLAYRSVPMPSIHDRKLTNLPEVLNLSQQAAVSAAMNTQRNLLCIQGPPGTGKTRVIAEIVHQLLNKKKKVLVCAPTHVAVKNAKSATMRRICQEIPGETAEKQLLILNSSMDELQNHPSVSLLETTQTQLAKTSKTDPLYRRLAHQCYTLRSSIYESIYSPRKAIFSTLGTSFIQKLPYYGWKADVMIVDEAAQCTEPSTWVPLLTTPTCKKLILVGDHKQLPAIILSDKAVQENMRVSLMEKLADEFANNNINILLKEQYRMNEKIMRWSNDVFYDNQLVAHSSVANITLKDLCPNIPENYVINNPILMIDMVKFEHRSQEDQTDATSFSNDGELNVITDYVRHLVADVGVDPSDIAVIAPYFAQVAKLRQSIPFRIDVNTVDAFQGHEREVIIFCLVRDNDEGVIGFLRQTRRLNVAVTRARRQFVLIGSSKMMHGNKELRKLYKQLQSEKVVFGPEIFESFEEFELPSMNKQRRSMKI